VTHPHLHHPCTDLAKLRAIIAAAATIYTAPPRRAAALTYLRQRGIDPADLPAHWRLGYAPPGWTRLVDTLRGRFGDQALLDAGLARRCSHGTLIDTFRDRVLFPLHGTDGHVAGFIGRDLSGDETAPKYLNSPRSALFDKRALLYGLHEGSTADPSGRRPVVVEGPLDVLAIAAHAHATGDTDVLPVAACGTAFTITHARRVADIAGDHRVPVVVALDGDAAGRTAALTAGEHLRYAGLDVRVAVLPNGVDPAEHVAHGGTLDFLRPANALPLITVNVERAIAAQGDRMQWIEGRLAAARAITSYLATYPPHQTATQIAWISQAVSLDPTTVTFELAAAYRSSPDRFKARDDDVQLHVVGRSNLVPLQ
jgi:DNA primase